MNYQSMNEPYFGLLNLLKPPGMTSAHAVACVRRLFDGAKVGHAGTLDPEASGVLPLMIGKASRLFDYLQLKEKTYIAEIAFGSATDTQDAQGVVVDRCESEFPDQKALEQILPAFTGNIMQAPPAFSALHQNGQRLYELARKGLVPEIEARPVTVHSLRLLQMTERHGALIEIHCSKGFYVRTLCHDIGKALGCGAHMRFLLRTGSGLFQIDQAYTLEELANLKENHALHSALMTVEQVLPQLPIVIVPEQLFKAVRNGGVIPCDQFAKPNAIPDDDETPFGLIIDGKLCSIAKRDGELIHSVTWLAD